MGTICRTPSAGPAAKTAALGLYKDMWCIPLPLLLSFYHMEFFSRPRGSGERIFVTLAVNILFLLNLKNFNFFLFILLFVMNNFIKKKFK